MAKRRESTSGVSIGSVGGSIQNPIIAAGNVSKSAIGADGGSVSVDDLRKLLLEVQSHLGQISSQTAGTLMPHETRDALVRAEKNVNAVVSNTDSGSHSASSPASLIAQLSSAAKEIGGLVEGADKAFQGASHLVHSSTFTQLLSTLSEKLNTALSWASSLWS